MEARDNASFYLEQKALSTWQDVHPRMTKTDLDASDSSMEVARSPVTFTKEIEDQHPTNSREIN